MSFLNLNLVCVNLYLGHHAWIFFLIVIFDNCQLSLFFLQNISVVILQILILCVKLIVNLILVLQINFQNVDLIFMTLLCLYLLFSGLFVFCTDIVIILVELLNFKLCLGFESDHIMLIGCEFLGCLFEFCFHLFKSLIFFLEFLFSLLELIF